MLGSKFQMLKVYTHTGKQTSQNFSPIILYITAMSVFQRLFLTQIQPNNIS
jgi:hypothetical protein